MTRLEATLRRLPAAHVALVARAARRLLGTSTPETTDPAAVAALVRAAGRRIETPTPATRRRK